MPINKLRLWDSLNGKKLQKIASAQALGCRWMDPRYQSTNVGLVSTKKKKKEKRMLPINKRKLPSNKCALSINKLGLPINKLTL